MVARELGRKGNRLAENNSIAFHASEVQLSNKQMSFAVASRRREEGAYMLIC